MKFLQRMTETRNPWLVVFLFFIFAVLLIASIATSVASLSTILPKFHWDSLGARLLPWHELLAWPGCILLTGLVFGLAMLVLRAAWFRVGVTSKVVLVLLLSLSLVHASYRFFVPVATSVMLYSISKPRLHGLSVGEVNEAHSKGEVPDEMFEQICRSLYVYSLKYDRGLKLCRDPDNPEKLLEIDLTEEDRAEINVAWNLRRIQSIGLGVGISWLVFLLSMSIIPIRLVWKARRRDPVLRGSDLGN